MSCVPGLHVQTPIMEIRMEKRMENEMESGVNIGKVFYLLKRDYTRD